MWNSALSLAIDRPPCPQCRMRMIYTAKAPGPQGFTHRTFECLRCGYSETRMIADPIADPPVAVA